MKTTDPVKPKYLSVHRFGLAEAFLIEELGDVANRTWSQFRFVNEEEEEEDVVGNRVRLQHRGTSYYMQITPFTHLAAVASTLKEGSVFLFHAVDPDGVRECTCTKETKKAVIEGRAIRNGLIIGGCCVVGAGIAIAAAPFALAAVGFTSAGIASGSIAAGMISSSAIASGGGVAAGSSGRLAVYWCSGHGSGFSYCSGRYGGGGSRRCSRGSDRSSSSLKEDSMCEICKGRLRFVDEEPVEEFADS